MKLRPTPWVMVLLVGLGFPCFAGAPEMRGYVKFFNFNKVHGDYDFDRTGVRFQAGFSDHLSKAAAYSAAVNFNIDESKSERQPTSRRGAELNVYPVEAYIDLLGLVGNRLDLRLGKQFVFWGKTDWVNPTDNITPWDYVNIASEIEDYRIAVTALRANFYFGSLSFEAVAVPFFTPHKMDFHFPDTMGAFTTQVKPSQLPGSSLGNAELGVRLSHTFAGVDWSVSYFKGFDKYPTFVFRPLFVNRTPTSMEITPSHKALQVFGGDFSTAKGRFLFKGEGAYFATEDRDGADIFIPNSHIKYVISCGYTFSEKTSFKAQFIQDIRLKYDQAREERGWTNLGIPGTKVPQKITHSLSLVMRYQWGRFFESQLIHVSNLREGDLFLLPVLWYEITDGLKVDFGAVLFEGPEDSPFGKQKDQSRVFVEVKYSF